MFFRPAKLTEFPEIRDFYWRLIDRMSVINADIGWKKGIYPSDQYLKDSLTKGELYVLDGDKDMTPV